MRSGAPDEAKRDPAGGVENGDFWLRFAKKTLFFFFVGVPSRCRQRAS
jgi:hypothetical protein